MPAVQLIESLEANLQDVTYFRQKASQIAVIHIVISTEKDQCEFLTSYLNLCSSNPLIQGKNIVYRVFRHTNTGTAMT